MFHRDKPLFSRPVLAVIIVASTLAVWLLNLTDPKTVLEQPNIRSWQTSSDIPVYWVAQDTWSGSDKVEMTIVFHDESQYSALTKATWELLTGPTLPLSTATIKQRLTPLAAKAESHFAAQQQTLQISFSNQPQYLSATMKVLDTWLNQTQFKYSALQNRARNNAPDSVSQQLLMQLWPEYDISDTTNSPLTTDTLEQHLANIKQSVSHIIVAGALTESAQSQLQTALDQLTQTMAHRTTHSSLANASEPQTKVLGNHDLQALYGAIALTPLQSVTDWLALQIWAKDSLERQKQQLHSNIGQWQLHLSPWQPYVTWQLQAAQSVLAADASTPAPESSWILPNTLPSYQDSKAFSDLKAQLLAQLANLSQNPTWWSAIGSRVAYPNSPLDLATFAEHYSEAANSFTMSQYQAAIDRLLVISSRQEVLVKL